MRRIILSLTATLVLFAFKSDKNAYTIFDARGKECHYAKMLDEAKNADVVLFGEQQNS
ncbi:MAG TPA: hypothetical protein VIK10_05440 [Prolixibacteraceae bacterium]